jgi:TPR repeat protein
MSKTPIQLFIAYSPEDESIRKILDDHLSILKKLGEINTWYDGDIIAGQEYDKVTASALESSDIILLLISPSFLSSEYSIGTLMKGMTRQNGRKAYVVLPVILKACAWDLIPELNNLPTLPEDGKPIASRVDADQALTDSIRLIHKIVKEFSSPEPEATTDVADTATSSPAAVPPDDLERGIDACENNDFETGIPILLQYKSQPDFSPKACYFLATAYELGNQVELDLIEAAMHYKKAADAGYPPAQYSLGAFYEQGTIGAKDNKKAIYWYEKAAAQGLEDARFHLGNLYYLGEIVEQNHEKAFVIFEELAKKGNAHAQLMLGMYYDFQETSHGLSPEDAYYWYWQSSKQGYAAAKFNLGMMYLKGSFVKKDIDEAFRLVVQSANDGFPYANKYLGDVNMEGVFVEKDIPSAIEWYKVAAELGDGEAPELLKKLLK